MLLLETKEGRTRRVPCGACMACRINRRETWARRLLDEYEHADKAVFVTMTYDDDNLPDPPSVSVYEAQTYIKRLRKAIEPRTLRYYISGEYGEEKDRPHYHAILFGLGKEDYDVMYDNWAMCVKDEFVVGDVNPTTCNYTAGYIVDKLTGKFAEYYTQRNIAPPFSIMSRYPIIGIETAKKYMDNHIDRAIAGKDVMPRAYRNQMTTAQRARYELNIIKPARLESEESISQRERDILTKIQIKRRKL